MANLPEVKGPSAGGWTMAWEMAPEGSSLPDFTVSCPPPACEPVRTKCRINRPWLRRMWHLGDYEIERRADGYTVMFVPDPGPRNDVT